MLPLRVMTIGGGGNRFKRTITLANSPSTVNMRTLANNLGYLGDRPIDFVINVPPGVQLDRGFYFGAWPDFAHSVVLNVDGVIHGAEGIGGDSSTSVFGVNGGAGGDAINCQLDATINLSATGALKGGSGGGGSGGGSSRLWGPPGEEELQELYGGQGGNGWPIYSAGVGNGGNGGIDPATAGVNGGNGSAPTTGTYPWTNHDGGTGGPAGYAIRHNGHTITVNNTGGIIVGTSL